MALPPQHTYLERRPHLPRIARSVLIVLDGLLVFLFVAGYAARFVHPGRVWWIQLIASALPLLSILIIGATIAHIARRSRPAVWVHLFLCLLIPLRFIPFERMMETTKVDIPDLRVVSFNAPYKYHEDQSLAGSALGRSVHQQALLPLLRTEVPDVICLQGTGATVRDGTRPPKVHPHVEKLLENGYSLLPSSPSRANVPERQEQPIFGRLPIEDVSQIPIRMPASGKFTTAVTRTVFQWQDQLFAVYNMHLRSFHGTSRPWEGNLLRWLNPHSWRYLAIYREDYAVRAHEAISAKKILERETLPFIVCGDLNSTPHDWVYQHLSRGLRDTFHEAGNGWGATYHSRFPLVRIDYVFTSPEWSVVSASVADDVQFSDHLPVVARLGLRSRD